MSKSNPIGKMTVQTEEFAIRVGGYVLQLVDRETSRPFTSFHYEARIGQIASTVDYLRRRGQDPSWIIFSAYNTPDLEGRNHELTIDLQYTKVGGIVGLEWVLLAPRNIADRSRITKYIRRRKHKVLERELNGVSFLRIEDGDLVSLGQGILEDIYSVNTEIKLGLVVGRLTMSPEWKSRSS